MMLLTVPKANACALLIDFSSAFNTLQPHFLMQKLKAMSVNPFILKWHSSFLTKRAQLVRVNNTVSEPRQTSTGAPQGCVSSPVLVTLYTNKCARIYPENYIIKFSDDTVILSLMRRARSPSVYHSEVERFVHWCVENDLVLNVKKTEEMVSDPRGMGDHQLVVIHSEPITQVCSYTTFTFSC